MIEENIEILKWFIAVPSAVIATITIPWVMKKYYLECKKLSLEINLLKNQQREFEKSSTPVPGMAFTVFAKYWPAFSYGSMALFLAIGIATKIKFLILIAMLSSLVLFAAGSCVEEHYDEVMRKIEKKS